MAILRLLWYPKRNGEWGFHSDVLLAGTQLSGHGLLSSYACLIAPQALGQEWEQRPGFLSPSSECSILFSTFLHERIKHVWISSLETPVYWLRVMGLPLLILGCLANPITAAVTDDVRLLKAYLSAHWKCPPLASLAAFFPFPFAWDFGFKVHSKLSGKNKIQHRDPLWWSGEKLLLKIF